MAKAIDLDLWNWIEGKEDLKKRPETPESITLELASALNPAEDGPAGSAAFTSTETFPPTTVTERYCYLQEKELEFSIYQHFLGKYKEQQDRIHDLRSWVAETVCKSQYWVYCKAEQSLKQWYELLSTHAKGSEKELKRILYQRYEKVITPTAKPPRNWSDWCDSWMMAIIEARQGGLPEIHYKSIWRRDFYAAVSPHFPRWVEPMIANDCMQREPDLDESYSTVFELRERFLAHVNTKSGQAQAEHGHTSEPYARQSQSRSSRKYRKSRKRSRRMRNTS